MQQAGSRNRALFIAHLLRAWLRVVNGGLMRLRVPPTRISEIVHEARGISPDTAMRLARYCGTTAEFWMNL